ncbi:MAG TPA: flagellar motor protein [Bryobacteraceae bacterium]|nr:flagellar motor protein [Bryobacteraceae bacterium]
MAKTNNTPDTGSKADVITLVGMVLALAGLFGGLFLEGGSLTDIAQITAAMIVLGGTAGATMISTPHAILRGSLRRLRAVFFDQPSSTASLLETILDYATRARKNGIVSLEEEVDGQPDPFLRKALTMAVDGTDVQEIRSMMEVELGIEEERAEAEAKVLEIAGGFAPTVGIIGAVMGLIQVMKHLENIEEVGHGIAVAFVATVYGVGFANLFLLPAASKMKARARQSIMYKEMALEGVVGIVEGLNPKLIRSKLEPYLEGSQAATTSAARERRPSVQAA